MRWVLEVSGVNQLKRILFNGNQLSTGCELGNFFHRSFLVNQLNLSSLIGNCFPRGDEESAGR